MPPKKRTSGGAPQGKSKAARTSKGGANQALPVPPHAVMMPHIKMFDDWVKLNSICMHLWQLTMKLQIPFFIIPISFHSAFRNENLVAHGLTMDKFLERALQTEVQNRSFSFTMDIFLSLLNCQVKQKDFFAFIEAEFPANSSQPWPYMLPLKHNYIQLAPPLYLGLFQVCMSLGKTLHRWHCGRGSARTGQTLGCEARLTPILCQINHPWVLCFGSYVFCL